MRKVASAIVSMLPLLACGGGAEEAEAPVAEAPEMDGRAEAQAPANLQVVQVTVEGDRYIFAPASVRSGMPVRLVFDPEGLPGCSKDVTIPEFEITQFIDAEHSTIEFTPEAPGPISVACSMKMYTGVLTAEE